MNFRAVGAIYKFEMARARRTIGQSIVSPVISTSLYFIVFGSAIGSRIQEIDGISYGAFIVPGLVPEAYRDALESLPTWDEWDPDTDRWYYDWSEYAEGEAP